MQKAVVLEGTGKINIREIDCPEEVGARDIRIDLKRVGICGSDVHYYTHGAIGHFVVNEPMVLGHEASGIISEVGDAVKEFKVGDRVCMEPGIPEAGSRPSRMGMYNLCPSLTGYHPNMSKVQAGFWATPPVHGVMRPSVVHPADFTFKVPDNVSLDEAAMAEPVAIGMHAATKAQIRPGATCVVQGAGTIGCVTAMSALASGAGRVFVSDISPAKLDIVAAQGNGNIIPINVSKENLAKRVYEETQGWGTDYFFEATGNEKACSGIFDCIAPGGTVILIGHPGGAIKLDVVPGQVKEVQIKTIFRYAHVFPAVLALMGKGTIDVKPLISNHFEFKDAVQAFDFSVKNSADCFSSCVKNMLIMD
jgi:D-xylulose reductase